MLRDNSILKQNCADKCILSKLSYHFCNFYYTTSMTAGLLTILAKICNICNNSTECITKAFLCLQGIKTDVQDQWMWNFQWHCSPGLKGWATVLSTGSKRSHTGCRPFLLLSADWPQTLGPYYIYKCQIKWMAKSHFTCIPPVLCIRKAWIKATWQMAECGIPSGMTIPVQ